ncbi:MAG: hypothetical protein WC551_07110 [Patescibacteria group bacterium]
MRKHWLKCDGIPTALLPGDTITAQLPHCRLAFMRPATDQPTKKLEVIIKLAGDFLPLGFNVPLHPEIAINVVEAIAEMNGLYAKMEYRDDNRIDFVMIEQIS